MWTSEDRYLGQRAAALSHPFAHPLLSPQTIGSPCYRSTTLSSAGRSPAAASSCRPPAPTRAWRARPCRWGSRCVGGIQPSSQISSRGRSTAAMHAQIGTHAAHARMHLPAGQVCGADAGGRGRPAVGRAARCCHVLPVALSSGRPGILRVHARWAQGSGIPCCSVRFSAYPGAAALGDRTLRVVLCAAGCTSSSTGGRAEEGTSCQTDTDCCAGMICGPRGERGALVPGVPFACASKPSATFVLSATTLQV